MIKAAISHKGTVMLDVISPCVTFNDHEGSTKSYKYVKEHEEAIHEVGFVPPLKTSPWTTTPALHRRADARRFASAVAKAGRRIRSQNRIIHHPDESAHEKAKSSPASSTLTPRLPASPTC